jgi:hypothetical protein
MKKSRFCFLVWVSALLFYTLAPAQEKNGSQQTLKLLTVGNSFADNAMSYFPKLVESAGDKVIVSKANLGGCSLERHVRHLKAYEANPQDPEGSPYGTSPKFCLKQALQSDTWDYVTIQQVSTDSFKGETFEPYAGTLIGYIHKYAPQAKVVVFQTWAYREDYPDYGKDGFTQQKMYDALRKNYEKVASDYKLKIIPVGHAFQAARATERWHFTFPDPAFDYKNPAAKTVPQQPGSLNSGWYWMKPKDGGESTFTLDFKHGNDYGKYLASAVFYEALFGKDVQKAGFVPDKMDPSDAAALRRIAHDAFISYKQ